MQWDGLDPRTRARLVALAREQLCVTEDGDTLDVETWASSLDVELTEVLVLEALGEIASHPGPNDVHEQREDDQEVEGILYWPPHLDQPWGTRGGRR
jgi:hypothetical protein